MTVIKTVSGLFTAILFAAIPVDAQTSIALTVTQSSSQIPGTLGTGTGSANCPNTVINTSASFTVTLPSQYRSIAQALGDGYFFDGTGIGSGAGTSYQNGDQCDAASGAVGPETYSVRFTQNSFAIQGFPDNIGVGAVNPDGVWHVSPTAITYNGPYFQQTNGPQIGTMSFSINGDIGVGTDPSIDAVEIVPCPLAPCRVQIGGAVAARVHFTGVAPEGGTSVRLFADAVWPSNAPTPKVARFESDSVSTTGATIDVPIQTAPFLFPVVVTVRAAINSVGKTAQVTVMPTPLGTSGPEATARVRAIVDYFGNGVLSPRVSASAASDLNTLRILNSLTSTDPFLAAAEHYYVGANLVFDAPDSFFVAALKGYGLVDAYEVLKRLGLQPNSNGLPGSAPDRLILNWGEHGVFDALLVRFGPTVVKGVAKKP